MTQAKPPIAVVSEDVRELKGDRTTFRAATVVAADTTFRLIDVDVAGVGQVDGLYVEPSSFFPKVGDEGQVRLDGARPSWVVNRVGEGAIGEDELTPEVVENITVAMDAANGKNKVFFSTDGATSATPGSTAGDLWFQKDIYGLGVIVASWEWTGAAWSPRFFGDSVLNSLTVGKIVGGTATFDVLMAGSIYSATSGTRYRLDSTGFRFWSGSDTTPTIDFNAIAGSATFRGTVEGALIRTASAGQRLEIQSGGTAGGRTLTFYPAGAGQPARVLSRDDEFGHAGITMEAGGAARGFVNFTSTFADIGFTKPEGSSFVRVGDSAFGVQIGVEAGRGMSIATTAGLYLYSGATMFARLSGEAGLERISKFSLDGAASSFTFGLTAGQPNADIYALRFISTNPGATGGFVYFSDRRLKKNVKAAKFDGLAEVMATPINEFLWRESGQAGVGFVADQVPADAQVHLSPDEPMGGMDNPVGISSEVMLVKVWKAVQELNMKVDAELIRGKK